MPAAIMTGSSNVSERGPISLGGHMFVPLERVTFASHAWTMDIVYAAGLHEPGDDLAAFIARVFASGRVCDLLAGLYVEDGQKWDAARARTNSRFFAELTDPAEFLTLGDVLAEELLRFFLASKSFSAHFRSSSTPLTLAPGRAGSPAAPSTVATGTSSSASSLSTTPIASSRS